MYDHPLVVTLIDMGAKRLGSVSKIAHELEIPTQHVFGWKAGRRKAQPHDIAALAELAGLDALKFLAKAQLDELEGSKKGAILARSLGKLALAIGGATAGVSAHANPVIELIRCILC